MRRIKPICTQKCLLTPCYRKQRLLMQTLFSCSSVYFCIAANPFSRSAMMSSMCSVPIDRRMVLGEIPWSFSSASVSWEWVVEAGWITRLFTSATLASRENIFRLSINFQAASCPPWTDGLRFPPAGAHLKTPRPFLCFPCAVPDAATVFPHPVIKGRR